MTLYTRRQLALLLAVVALAGLGLAVAHVRRSHPALVDRLERLDRAPGPPGAATPAPPPRRREGPAAIPLAEDMTPPRVDLNRAPLDELMRLPGIGPGLAARIAASRDADGPFGSPEDLRRVRGLGRKTLERLRPHVTVE